jgi:hypothetical protein
MLLPLEFNYYMEGGGSTAEREVKFGQKMNSIISYKERNNDTIALKKEQAGMGSYINI